MRHEFADPAVTTWADALEAAASMRESARRRVACYIFIAARPGVRWDKQPPAVVDYWLTLADAALVAMREGKS